LWWCQDEPVIFGVWLACGITRISQNGVVKNPASGLANLREDGKDTKRSVELERISHVHLPDTFVDMGFSW